MNTKTKTHDAGCIAHARKCAWENLRDDGQPIPASPELLTDETQFIDLFAGPGGWDVAARMIGLPDPVGIEWDHAACETRRAARMVTIEADVRNYGPLRFPGASGLIASPPCQTFSPAGKGAGRKALDKVVALATWVAQTGLAPARTTFEDQRTSLVLEPLRWIVRAHQHGKPYRYVALEQVATVLPVWEAYADHLRALGYSVATGVINAEQYGVPQTRRRAVLLARLDGPVTLPPPTHSRYYPRGPGRLDLDVEPWVTMADALGWTPAHVVTSNYGTGGDPQNRGERTGGEPAATVTSKIGRNKVTVRTSLGEPKVDGRNGHHTLDPTERPAHTVTTKAGSWEVRADETPPVYVNGNQPNAARRSADKPAPTVHFGHRMNDVRWAMGDVRSSNGTVRPQDTPAPTGPAAMDNGNFQFIVTNQRAGGGDVYTQRPTDRPAPTITTVTRSFRLSNDAVNPVLSPGVKGGNMATHPTAAAREGWEFERPATTVAGDPRIGGPGRRERDQGERQYGPQSRRVTVAEAACLQTFPVGFPWQGTQTKQFEQVGNAVPPLLAACLLSWLVWGHL